MVRIRTLRLTYIILYIQDDCLCSAVGLVCVLMLCMGSWLICVYVTVGCGGFGAGSGDQSSLFFLSSGRLILHKYVCVGAYVVCG